MAFFLKSTKLIHTFASFSCQRGLIGRRKNYFFLRNSNVFNFNQSPLRTTASLPAPNNTEGEQDSFEKSLFQLSRDIQNNAVFIDNFKDVFNAIKQRGEITQTQIILLLKCCTDIIFMSTNTERIKLAEEIWNTASELGTKFHISHYNALLNVFLENDHKFSPSEFLKILENAGVEPNLITYRRILRAYCKQGDIEGASDMLKKMSEQNLPMSEEDFNSLILGYCEIGDLDKAHNTLKIMEEKDIDPTSNTYTHLLCGYAKHGEIQKMKDLMHKELPEKDVALNDHQLLEIVYAMAVNDKAEDIDFVLNELNGNSDIIRAAGKIIQRLLHLIKDSVALKVFQHVEQSLQSSQYLINESKRILDHFVMYRSPVEIVDLCQIMENKGWYKNALAYSLREIFHKKDEEFCLQLMDAMRSRGMELRIHYYWPAIIKASKKGNSEMSAVLKKIPQRLLSSSRDTLFKVVFPNYNHGNDWIHDLEFLGGLGFGRRRVAGCFAIKFLREEQFDKVETVVSTFPISQPVAVAKYFARLLSKHPKESERFVNVSYLLAHDFFPLDKLSAELFEEACEEEDEVSATSNRNFLNFVLPSVLRISDEKVVCQVLEGLLEKKFTIPPETAAEVTSADKELLYADNDLVKDLVNKLTDPEIKFELSETVFINKKYSKKQYQTSDKDSMEKLSKEMEHLTLVERKMSILQKLVRSGKIEEAVQLIMDLPEQAAPDEDYVWFVIEAYKTGRSDLGRKVFDLGVQKGFLSSDQLGKIIRFLFSRKQFYSDAIDIYSNLLEKKRRLWGFVEFLNKVIAAQDDEATKKMMSMAMKYVPASVCLTHLILALALNGQVTKAKKLLKSKEITLMEKIVYQHLQSTYDESKAEQLENVVKVLRDVENFDRIPLYKMLIKKYAKENDVTKVKELWLSILEDDISNYDFLEQMREFINNPTVDHLKNLSSRFETMDYSGPLGVILFKNLLQHKHLDRAFSVAMSNSWPMNLVQSLIDLLCTEGRVSEAIQLMTKYEIRDSNKSEVLLKKGHVKEYLNFLQHYASRGEFRTIAECFTLRKNLTKLLNDEEAFGIYKSLAIECYEKGGLTKPLLCYFAACVCVSDKNAEAEEVFEKYFDKIKNVPLSELKTLVAPLEADFLINVLANDKMRPHYSEEIHAAVSSLIMFYCKYNKLKMAEHVLNQAVNLGVKNSINKDCLSILERKMLAKGRSFPYPELLDSQK